MYKPLYLWLFVKIRDDLNVDDLVIERKRKCVRLKEQNQIPLKHLKEKDLNFTNDTQSEKK